MKSKILGLLAMGLLAGPIAANAVVVYEFTGGTFRSFVYQAPDFLTGNLLTTPESGLVSCTSIWGGCAAPKFLDDPVSLELTTIPSDTIGFVDSIGTSYYYFADGAFSAYGTYSEFLAGCSVCTLVVRPGSTAVPEPGTLALLGLGLAGLGLSRRRQAR